MLETHISTTGSELDPNGYMLTVDDSEEESASTQDTLFFNDLDEDNLFIMNADGSEPSPLTDTAADIDREPAWSPNGNRIAFARRPDCDVFEFFVISPDGSRIAFTGNREGDVFIHIISPDGSDEAILNNETINHGNADWSPLGQ